ncbi:MAG TPA: glycerophosphodiester phosphodiesterase family protein [Anaerolineaceae bacterium]|nr:glycerophosphodiester phosphodiesterase family protein [Anaerolineaceae bacterium]
MLEQFPRPLVFAHRGASAYAPENTLAAFELALRQGAPAIELDAKLSADGQVIVIHDPTLERTTGAAGKVSDFSLAQLQGLDAGSFFSVRYQRERIPTLEAVFETVGKQVLVNVELTNYTTPGDHLVDEVVHLVQRMARVEQVLFSSFDPRNLIRARRLLPQVPTGLLTQEGYAGALARTFLNRAIPHESLHPFHADVTPALIQSAHARGKKVFPWTVNDPVETRRLLAAGADGIFTDDPISAIQVIREVTEKELAD